MSEPAAKTAAELLGEYFEAEWDKLMKLPGFRFVMQHIIQQPEWCGAYGTAARPDSVNETFLQLGRQEIGQQMMALAQKCSPELWMRVLPEARQIHEEIKARSAPG